MNADPQIVEAVMEAIYASDWGQFVLKQMEKENAEKQRRSNADTGTLPGMTTTYGVYNSPAVGDVAQYALGSDPATLSEEVKQLCSLAAEEGKFFSYSEAREKVLRRRAGGRKSRFDRPLNLSVSEDSDAKARYSFEAQQSAVAATQADVSSDAARRRAERAVALCTRAAGRGEHLPYAVALGQAREEEGL
jgi:hypothetical protein